MAVKCYYFDVSALTGTQYDAALAALPWEERRQRVGRLVQPEARRLTLGAGALLAWALGQAGATDLTLSYGESLALSIIRTFISACPTAARWRCAPWQTGPWAWTWSSPAGWTVPWCAVC